MASQLVREPSASAVKPRRGRPPKLPEHERRSAVLDAAVARFADVGRAGATIDEIASAAGVRKPAIYEMFGSKDDLFRAAVDTEAAALSDWFRAVNAETADLARPDRTRGRVDAAFAYAEAHPDAFRLLARAPLSWPDDDPESARAVRDRLVAVIGDNYRRESTAAGHPLDVAADVLATLFFAMAEQAIQLRFSDPTWDRSALVDFLAAFIEGGIAGIAPDVWSAIEAAHPAAEPRG